MKILRIFPRKTNATPTDENVRIRALPGLFDEADEVHISVAFTWDMQWAEYAEKQWRKVAPVKLGGPAFSEKGCDFIPGMYMKQGYVITSRGCNNRCWFCNVPKREGRLRELPITNGWIVTDDNLLACSESHIDKVFEMLKRQPHRPQFTGGLEARLLSFNMAKRMKELNPVTMYFAYDTPDDYEPLVQAGKHLHAAGFVKTNHIARCYILCGYCGDTPDKAETRMLQAWDAGFFPMAMLYRDKSGKYDPDWKKFHREWTNKTIVGYKIKNAT